MQRRVLTVVLAVAALVLAGCGGGGSGGSSAAGAASGGTKTTYTSIIDVRTPAEYDASHVEGAVNMNVEDATFAQQIGTLAKDGTYLVYCRSGNRSGQATAIMKAAGLTVTDGGGLDAMKSAGYTFTG